MDDDNEESSVILDREPFDSASDKFLYPFMYLARVEERHFLSEVLKFEENEDDLKHYFVWFVNQISNCYPSAMTPDNMIPLYRNYLTKDLDFELSKGMVLCGYNQKTRHKTFMSTYYIKDWEILTHGRYDVFTYPVRSSKIFKFADYDIYRDIMNNYYDFNINILPDLLEHSLLNEDNIGDPLTIKINVDEDIEDMIEARRGRFVSLVVRSTIQLDDELDWLEPILIHNNTVN